MWYVRVCVCMCVGTGAWAYVWSLNPQLSSAARLVSQLAPEILCAASES